MTELRQIFVLDDLHPEDNAMLQALYSRSPESVLNHLEKVRESGSGKFMDRYYVGYGHASIGDCGSTTIFIENVSMLAAKAVQDHPLYSGQEASTRYLDFSRQPVVDPYNHPAAKAVQARWASLYKALMPKLVAGLERSRPFDPDKHKSESVWRKAIQARAFDINRGLLPLGATTLLSWHTSLRQARDHLRQLAVHPLAEVRDLAQAVHAALCAKYRNSFSADELDAASPREAARVAYEEAYAESSCYLSAERASRDLSADQLEEIRAGAVVFDDRLYDAAGVNRHEADLLAARPRGALLPRRLEEYGQSSATFLIDMGSFRDLQRHRNCIYQSPLVTTEFGFHAWYMRQWEQLLLAADYAALRAEIDAGLSAIDDLAGQGVAADDLRNQYLLPMGVAALTRMTHGLPQMVYVAELRSAKTVHPTARAPMQALARHLKRLHPEMALYADLDADDWSVRRGEQDITQRSLAV
jgi:thymidylate synthase ThyX